MKKLTLLLLVISSSYSLMAQEYVNKMVDAACECSSDISTDLSSNERQMQLGLCIIKAAEPYSKQLEKDFDVDMDNIVEEGEKLGMVIGAKMAGRCPEVIMSFADLAEDEEDTEDYANGTLEGKVVKIEDQQIVVFHVKSSSGRIEKVYWIDFVNSEFNLQYDYENLLGEEVKILHQGIEVFDPKAQEYREVNVLRSLSVL